MDKMIEVRYAGVVVGRSAIVRELDTRGLFLGITEPMPVGTPVVLRIAERGGADIQGKVEFVSESQELVHAGMRVRFVDPASAALFGTPVQAPPEPEPVAPPAAASPAASASPAVAPDSEAADDEGDLSGAVGGGTAGSASVGTDGRIPAPDPGAFSGGGGGKKGRRNRRR